MIEHVPYGNDDPYKSTPVERFPRDPGPGESVQVGFRAATAVTAWVEVGSNSAAARRVEATSLGGGLWTADLGAFDAGGVEYELVAREEHGGCETARFAFDVGRWVEVSGVGQVALTGDRVSIELRTTGAPARLDVSFPTTGACRCELWVGERSSRSARAGESGLGGPLSGAPRLDDTSTAATVRGDGITLHIDKEGLSLRAVPSAADGAARATGPTGAVAAAGAASEAGADDGFTGSLALRWLERSNAFSTPVELTFETTTDEKIYGLGERFTDADRNGQTWDVRVYEEYKEQRKRTYIPIPFLVSNRGYGLWVDVDEPSYFDLTSSTAKVSFDRLTAVDRGREPLDSKQNDPERPLLSFCVFAAEKPYEMTAAFTRLTGTIAVPPKWAFGPWMSANTWNDQARAEEVIDRTLAEDVPASVLVLEAWSDESTFYIFNDAKYSPVEGGGTLSLEDFEFGGRWPDPKSLIEHCHANGIRVVLWQIPVHKRLAEPHVQHDADGAHMVEQGFAVLKEDGTPYRNEGWWFSDALVVDFTNPRAAAWWFDKRRYLFEDLGIDGFKTDGGEHLWGRDLRAHDGSRGLELFNTYANRYVEAYHEFVQQATGGDGVTFSRSGYTGAQRFPIHWAGDEDSTWNAYRASIRAGLSAGVSGVSMWSWDIAGFSGEIPAPDLYMRATAMAALCPIMQYHSEPHGASECRDRTPWNVAERHGDPAVLRVYRRYAHLRIRLLDYLHGEATALASRGLPLMRYPALEYLEAHDFLAEDEYAYLLGRDLLVVPVTERGVGTRAVRLPPGGWVDAWSGAELPGGQLFHAPAPIDRIPVFVRAESPRLPGVLAAFAEWSSGVGHHGNVKSSGEGN